MSEKLFDGAEIYRAFELKKEFMLKHGRTPNLEEVRAIIAQILGVEA